jgi:hypothetical protein
VGQKHYTTTATYAVLLISGKLGISQMEEMKTIYQIISVIFSPKIQYVGAK